MTSKDELSPADLGRACPQPRDAHAAASTVPSPTPRLSRRGLVLAGLGGLGVTACGGGDGGVPGILTPAPSPAPTPTPPPPPPPSSPGPSSITEISYRSTALNDSSWVKIYLPPGYATSGLRYPVVYMLHGRGDTLSSWGRNQAMFDELIAAGTIPAFIGVMPDAPSSNRGGYYVDSAYTSSAVPGAKVETAFMTELLPYIDANYRTLPQREARALAGYSMGAYGALRYAVAYPEQFSATIVMSPAIYTPLPPAGSSSREFGAFGSGNTLFVDEIYRSKTYPALLPAFAAKNLPLRMFISAGDDEYKEPNPAEAMNDIDMEAHLLFNRVSRIASVKAELRILNGDHDWPVWQATLREALPFIFKGMSKPA
jgi:enterochelin esterase-like enzyme